MPPLIASILAWMVWLALGLPAVAEEPHRGQDDATERHRFEDAAQWAQRFEDPARDAWQRPDSVLARLVHRDDLVVADIGSATGYFAVRFARALPRGVVIGADIEPDMVRYLNDRSRREGHANLVSVLAAPDDPHLPQPADLVFVCNTIHHIDGRISYFQHLADQLRPGARLAVVDWRPESTMGPPHKLDPQQAVEELSQAGWRLTAEHDVLPEQYFLIFERAE